MDSEKPCEAVRNVLKILGMLVGSSSPPRRKEAASGGRGEEEREKSPRGDF